MCIRDRVFSKTSFDTNSIRLFISLKEALPLFTKKLQCFSEIQASPKLLSKGTDSLINSQTFLFVCDLGFLKVLPLVLILVGCAFSFFLTKFSISFFYLRWTRF